MGDEGREIPDPEPEISSHSERADSVSRSVRSVEAAAIAGVAYGALGIVALIMLSSFPSLEQTDEELNEWFADAGNQTVMTIGLTLAAFASIAFLWFVAVIRRRLGFLEDRFFSTVFLGSGLTVVALWLAAAAAIAMPAVAMAHYEGATVTVSSASNAVGLSAAFLLVLAPRIQAVFILVTSVLILRSGALPRWLAVLGLIIALLMFVLPLVIEPLGGAFPVWVSLVSVVILVVRPGPAGRPAGIE